MARRQGIFEDLIDSASKFPWWVGVSLAVVVYLVLHAVAGIQVSPPKDIAGIGNAAVKTVYATVAGIVQWILPVPFLIGAALSEYGRYRRKALFDQAADSVDPDAIRKMSWQEFEMLVGEAFRRRGYAVVETGGGGADGGVDLLLKRGSDKFLVQCKQWRALKVGVSPVREHYGVMAAQGANGGAVVTSGVFTNDAIEFAKSCNLELIDGAALGQMIQGVKVMKKIAPEVSINSMFESAASGTAPSCPRCGAQMAMRVARTGTNSGNSFWGCSKFPDCRGTRDIAASA